MDETLFDNEVRVESSIEETVYNDSCNRNCFSMGLPNGFHLESPNNLYIIEKQLGHGTFGITYLARCNGRYVAIKEFFMNGFCGRKDGTYEVTGFSSGNQIDYYCRRFKLEASNLKKLNHKNIVKVYEAFEANKTCYYSMDYIKGCSLDSYIKTYGPMNEKDAVNCMLEISDAIEYLHEHRM